ncbi:hypothetical protein Tco_1019674 [Tanacetum coccineum]|uniref:Transposase (Putative), gypsy type n=1 Tax=Tanacetum coccineum TaxID=301880 RepID=A0ABQ5FZH9_9ASTR
MVCHTRPLDSLKHWNDHFLWVDASAFPLAVLWHNNKTLRKDPHPTPAEFNTDVCNYLATNLALFIKFSKPFLCFVDISLYYDLDDNCYPTFLTNDDEEMDLFAFIHHADPTKVRIGEREVGEGEVSLLELTRGRVVPLTGVNQGNKNEVVPDVGNQNDDAQDVRNNLIEGSAADDSSHHSSTNVVDDEVTFIVRSFVPPPPLMTATTATTVVADTSSILVPKAGEEPVYASIFADSTSARTSALDDPDVCRSLVDQLAPPALFSQLHSMDYEQLFAEFNVGASPEAAEAIRLHSQIATTKAAEAARVSELYGLKERNEGTCSRLRDELSGYKLFKEQIEAMQDEQVKILSDKVAGIDADLMGMALHMDDKFYPRFFYYYCWTRWILSRGLRLVVIKCLQSPEYLAALGGAIGRAIDKGGQDGLAACDILYFHGQY